MKTTILKTNKELGQTAAIEGSLLLKEAIKRNGVANIILATGSSQFLTIEYLLKEDIEWSKVNVFHLDEYIGITASHKASFRKYLKERFVDKVKDLNSFTYINTQNDPSDECDKLEKQILEAPIDVAFVGIGENGHLAFNDPPADFSTNKSYLVVTLDSKCRMQQFNEGWFKSFDEVPTQAISMSIKQIMQSKHIIVSVPDTRKALAVKNSIQGEVTNLCPSSILQNHNSCSVYLDKNSASLL